MTMVTRLGYCENCAKEHSPKTNQMFLVMGSSKGVLKPLYASHNGRAGFVPMFYLLKKVKEDKVYYQRCCSICNCGTYLYTDNDKTYLTIDESKWSNWKATSLKNWNSLILFKDTGFEI